MDEQSIESENESDNRSELVSVFQAHPELEKVPNITKFLWFQWVISRAAVIVAGERVKLAFQIEDVITSIDMQDHYNQLKVKVGTASVKQYKKTGSNDWTAGVLGGRVIEAREPANDREDTHFLAVTITQARISNLPATWKEELHPKILEQRGFIDSMWEIYAMLAPLEAILQPEVLDNIISFAHEMAPRSFCPLKTEIKRKSTWQWPFCYINAGGLRLLITCNNIEKNMDDTFIIIFGRISVNPHPENPICRRPINTGAETGWLAAGGGYEGRQYEVMLKGITLRTACFSQVVLHEESVSDSATGMGNDNPAHKWSQQVVTPIMTPVIRPVDINCVMAPALYVSNSLICGPGVEINLLSDCTVEFSVEQLELVHQLISDTGRSLREQQESVQVFYEDKHDVCPYGTLLMPRAPYEDSSSDTSLSEDEPLPPKNASETGRSLGDDSGVDTVTSHSTLKSPRKVSGDTTSKKTVSLAFFEFSADPKEYVELFVTMGTIELSLYTADDDSPEIVALRPEGKPSRPAPEVISENIVPQVKKTTGCIPLLHVTLHQPNLYYWRKKTQRSLQVSLFNAWVGLGAAPQDEYWNAVLMSTARGVPDPVTDIPPALATMKLSLPTLGSTYLGSTATISTRGTIHLDIERPVLFEICADRLRRLNGIYELVESKIAQHYSSVPEAIPLPILYKLRRFMVQNSIETATIRTSQIGVSGNEGSAGWDSASLQVALGTRPDRLLIRSLVSAALVAAGPPTETRHSVLQPLQLGFELNATWETWRRVEGGLAFREPTVQLTVEMDSVLFDVRPSDLSAISRIREALSHTVKKKKTVHNETTKLAASKSTENVADGPTPASAAVNFDTRMSRASMDSSDTDHYYKDDLRSGAFKIVSGGQLPMAYQVTLHGDAVSWRYPHPRAITRLVTFPLPGQDKETKCVLEMFNRMLDRWEPHTYFSLPVNEPREIQIYVPPPETVFATTWRFRVCSDKEESPYVFSMDKFSPRQDPLMSDIQLPTDSKKRSCSVSAEELSGVLRVDSYFAPRLLPRMRVAIQIASMELHAHNSMLYHSSPCPDLEGYYVSKPQMRSHRVLSINAYQTTVYGEMGSIAGVLMLLKTNMSSDILECATGTMEQLVDEFRVQVGLSLPECALDRSRMRFRTSSMRVVLHVPRIRTLQALAVDWKHGLDQMTLPADKAKSKREITNATMMALEGRVSVWLHNACAVALRAGQEGTDEVLPLASGAKLAYRWRNPNATRKLRFALATPSVDWKWSDNISFAPGSFRIRLEGGEILGGNIETTGGGVYLYVSVEQIGSIKCMRLSGRLMLANMLRLGLLYKVRMRVKQQNTWRTVCSGELAAEAVGQSVICGSNCEMVLKIRFANQETSWSGDIPLKECPKENVPWLVKVPSEGDIPYISVWCRVVRARYDGRILATVWPLYVLHSHLPLDTDVLIVTESSSLDVTTKDLRPAPVIQAAPGRGTSTHLVAPGTTSARHSLSFQYRNIECPVTREAAPLHYGVTDTSVFDKRGPVAHIEEVLQEVTAWLQRSSHTAQSTWPYSLVAKHWPGTWQPALLQPRCDVTVRYQAVRAGGGCSLELQLSPVVLLCNASPIALTLRAHDAAPLCKLEPGAAISPSTAMLTKPFFMSVEIGRETFVSGQLEVCSSDPGRYGTLPLGQVAIDHPTNFAIQCNHKVALFTLYYEIKHYINVIGITSTYLLVNRLKTTVLVSAIAVPGESEKEVPLYPKTFKILQATKEDTIDGIPLCRFWLRDRWRGSDVSQLHTFLCVALPSSTAGPAHTPVPVRLGTGPTRRVLALVDHNQQSVAVVVTQHKHEGRWLVTIATDPCPQFVVHNRTRHSMAIGQPTARHDDEPSASVTTVVPDCQGARYWCAVKPSAVLHYSTPAHCARHPAATDVRPTVPFLTFSRLKEDLEPDWCAPVAAAEGEQLVQLARNVTVKLRVRTHPHSTLIELQDVDQTDISASDIRKRLVGPFSSDESLTADVCKNIRSFNSHELERIDADETLLQSAQHGSIRSTQMLRDRTISSLEIYSETSLATSNLTTLSGPKLDVLNADDTSNKGYETDDDFVQTVITQATQTGLPSEITIAQPNLSIEISSFMFQEGSELGMERIRGVIANIVVEMAATCGTKTLFAVHIDRAAVLVYSFSTKTKTSLAITNVQVDNLQYDTGQFDFAVVATTRADAVVADTWPTLWNMFTEQEAFSSGQEDARVLIKICHDKWDVVMFKFHELTEIDVRLGPLALYVEDAYVRALLELFRYTVPPTATTDATTAITEATAIQCPLRLRTLLIHPVDLTLTLHTAVRMYIALDQSPLHLSAFKLQDMMTSPERLAHAFTVHYLSAAILGAGWVVGGLELLGAPGALAARVGGATGGVKGIASAAAAALLRSLSAWAGSLARNLDLLAGDEEHARRAAAARRRPPDNFIAGLTAGLTNFAINILGAVGGLAHHPLVGVAVGETESGATALRRSLLGAVAKPLSATADLVAYAGHGLLNQTGWDPVPQPRPRWSRQTRVPAGWRRDCVRWTFRLAELTVLEGFEVLLNDAHLELLLTHKFIVVADPESQRVVEMIDLRFCTLKPYQGTIIELSVSQRRSSKAPDIVADDDDEYQISAAAMARVARYTGAEGVPSGEARVLSLLPSPGQSYALHAALATAIHHNSESHFPLM